MSFSEKNILIVGGGSSISKDIVRLFSDQGARIMVTLNKNSPEYLSKGTVKLASLDITNYQSMDKFCSDSLAAFGGIDILIFLTGFLPGKTLEDYDDEILETVMKINFTGQASFLKRILPNLRNGASILIMSSISGERGSYDPIYAAAKAAQIGFVKSLASWLSPNIRINAVAPALIENSSMFNAMSNDRREFHRAQTPTGKLITTSELAAIIVNLCEPAWSKLNGQVISVNGGSYV
jgi:3-oxoacyl-[acyl-carrier protein] reductase